MAYRGEELSEDEDEDEEENEDFFPRDRSIFDCERAEEYETPFLRCRNWELMLLPDL